jgi:hypothetical protein
MRSEKWRRTTNNWRVRTWHVAFLLLLEKRQGGKGKVPPGAALPPAIRDAEPSGRQRAPYRVRVVLNDLEQGAGWPFGAATALLPALYGV